MPARLLISLVALTLLVAACGGSSAKRFGMIAADEPGGVYLALGDSIAAGNGASDPATTGYPGLLAAALREELGPGLELRSLAVGGNTTQDVIDRQLAPAVEALRMEDVRLVTITIAGNDLAAVQNSPDAPACIADVTKPPCPVTEILAGTEERLDTILGELRAAGPDTPIVIELYANLFSGTGHMFEAAAEQAFGLINEVIVRAAERHDVLLADPRDAFDGRGNELTHIPDEPSDNHPTDAGYRVIADAFLAALGIED